MATIQTRPSREGETNKAPVCVDHQRCPHPHHVCPATYARLSPQPRISIALRIYFWFYQGVAMACLIPLGFAAALVIPFWVKVWGVGESGLAHLPLPLKVIIGLVLTMAFGLVGLGVWSFF